ncbi:hypothetical protein BaRGS_00033630 [Batillaria attramentaria]|uniref:Uncharacterized protein n=1 Tax=Batillaria attramentaria TaxID=370345 RepID=A0ABD0JK76_9CAEN
MARACTVESVTPRFSAAGSDAENCLRQCWGKQRKTKKKGRCYGFAVRTYKICLTSSKKFDLSLTRAGRPRLSRTRREITRSRESTASHLYRSGGVWTQKACSASLTASDCVKSLRCMSYCN